MRHLGREPMDLGGVEGCLRRLHRPALIGHRDVGRASISCRVKSACEPCIRAAITMEKPTPVATPATATSVWRTRKRTCVRAMKE